MAQHLTLISVSAEPSEQLDDTARIIIKYDSKENNPSI